MKFPRFIYALTHEATGKVYVGCTANVAERFRVHLCKLKSGKHPVPDLQSDFDRHENKNISVTVLDTVRNWDERVREFEWMHHLQTNDRRRGYNYLDHHFSPGNPKGVNGWTKTGGAP